MRRKGAKSGKVVRWQGGRFLGFFQGLGMQGEKKISSFCS